MYVLQKQFEYTRHILRIDTYSSHAQQDYYGPQYGTLLHSYCTCTYTEVTALLLRSI